MSCTADCDRLWQIVWHYLTGNQNVINGMNKAIILCIFTLNIFIFPALSPSGAQDVRFWYSPETEQFAADQFRTDLLRDGSGSSMRIREGELIFANGSAMVSGFRHASISEDRSFVGVLFVRGDQVAAEIYRSDGSLLHRISRIAGYDPGDPSIRLYMLNNGSFVYRDNIASFTYFDERGKEVFRIFNSTGSPEGEAVSEFASTPFGNRMVAFNPRIFHTGQVGSRIRDIRSGDDGRTLTQSPNRSIRSVRMHPSGRLILAHLLDESSDRHYAMVLSVRGDILADIDYEENEIEEVVLSPCARYLTGRASGRAMVHEVASGERLGSASFRERVQVASWMPDGKLAVLTGTRNSTRLENIRMHVIDVRQRRVVREETGLTVHTSPHFPLSLQYERHATYRLQGTNRELIIRHSL